MAPGIERAAHGGGRDLRKPEKNLVAVPRGSYLARSGVFPDGVEAVRLPDLRGTGKRTTAALRGKRTERGARLI